MTTISHVDGVRTMDTTLMKSAMVKNNTEERTIITILSPTQASPLSRASLHPRRRRHTLSKNMQSSLLLRKRTNRRCLLSLLFRLIFLLGILFITNIDSERYQNQQRRILLGIFSTVAADDSICSNTGERDAVVFNKDGIATAPTSPAAATTTTAISDHSDVSTVPYANRRTQGLGTSNVVLDCDPCVNRSIHTIRAIVHYSDDDPDLQILSSSMKQAASDMGVSIVIESFSAPFSDGNSSLSSSDYNSTRYASMIEAIQKIHSDNDSSTSTNDSTAISAILVTVPDSTVADAIKNLRSNSTVTTVKPMFGIGVGADLAKELYLHGYIDDGNGGGLTQLVQIQAEQEALSLLSSTSEPINTNVYSVGQAAALEFVKYHSLQSNMSSSSSFRSAVYVDSVQEPMYTREHQLQTYTKTLRDNGVGIVARLTIDPDDPVEHERVIRLLFDGCPYQAVLLNSIHSVPLAITAKDESGCGSATAVGSTQIGKVVHDAITLGSIQFGIDTQLYLRSAFSVVLASLYVTTGKLLTMDTSGFVPYLSSGPVVVTPQNIPSDTVRSCQEEAFPICNGVNVDTSSTNSGSSSSSSSSCDCIDRSKITIGGVIHGVKNDNFWNPVVSGAHQAAKDMGIVLDMVQFEDDSLAFIEEKMAARIRTLCEGGVNGIFVTFPGNVSVVDSVKKCLELKVPVISINTGNKVAAELGLINHIAQSDYTTGYEAGKRLLQDGMKYGYCLVHESGSTSLIERCQAFQDAITESTNSTGGAMFLGEIEVPKDNRIQFRVNVESAVNNSNITINEDWDGIGLLSMGNSLMDGLREIISVHPLVLSGTFDVGAEVLDAIDEDITKFGIDQQPFFQGSLPVYLLTYITSTNQRILNRAIESGGKFVTEPASEAEKVCEANLFEVCVADEVVTEPPDMIAPTASPISGSNETDTEVEVFNDPVVNLDCDPCIDRTIYTLHAILHGRSDDDFWQQALASMKQAAKDMRVNIDVKLQESDWTSDRMSEMIREAAFNDDVDGIIVSIPDVDVEATVKDLARQSRAKPMFGMNVGYQFSQSSGLQGFIGQNDVAAGLVSATTFIEYFTNATTNSTRLKSAVYVSSQLEPAITATWLFQSFQKTLADAIKSVKVDKVDVNPNEPDLHESSIKELFENCPYQAVLLASKKSYDFASFARTENKCIDTQIGIVSVDRDIYQDITSQSILFGVDQEIYLQAAMTVILASLYITTGKKPALPTPSKSYLSNAVAITKMNVPTDSEQFCLAEAFPICDGYFDENFHQKKCTCIDRSKITIGGVLHGVTTDDFWDPVFDSAEQAGADMGVDLDNKRLDPQKNDTVTHNQMAARITTLCQQGFKGLFVTIPDKIVTEAVQLCNDLEVPVISINSGATDSNALGLHYHIAQVEYVAGLDAGRKLIAAGMKDGYCLDHAPGNPSTADRCRGFVQAITESNGKAVHKKTFAVPSDNVAQYKLDVEENVDQSGDWDGIGFMVCGQIQLGGIREVVKDHSKLIAGIFDTSQEIYDSIEEGWLKFAIDQQPFLQGNLAVYLLTYLTYSKQTLQDHNIESGPNLQLTPPGTQETVCADNNYKVCIEFPEENMNYIPDQLLGFGYAMFALMGLMCVCTGLWTFYYRQQWIVKVSQPSLLGLVIVGCFISSLSIFFLGVQTAYPNEQDNSTREPTGPENPDIDKADASCMAVPWLYGMGFVLSFSSLFAKIQRVKMIYFAGLRMQRKTIGFKDVAYIMACLLVIELTILTTWQFASPLKWERVVLTEDAAGFPTSSVGGCTYEDSYIFYVILVFFHVLCLFYALALCFQTKDINSDFAESSYISLAVAFMFQVLVLSVPISALVRDSTKVFYFIRVTSIFLQNFTVMALLFIPKMIKLYYESSDDQTTSGTSGAGKFHLKKNNSTNYGLDNKSKNSRHSLRGSNSRSFDNASRSGEEKLSNDSNGARRLSDMLFHGSIDKTSSEVRLEMLSSVEAPQSPFGQEKDKVETMNKPAFFSDLTPFVDSNETEHLVRTNMRENDELMSPEEDLNQSEMIRSFMNRGDPTGELENEANSISITPSVLLSRWEALGFSSRQQAQQFLRVLISTQNEKEIIVDEGDEN